MTQEEYDNIKPGDLLIRSWIGAGHMLYILKNKDRDWCDIHMLASKGEIGGWDMTVWEGRTRVHLSFVRDSILL